MDLKSVQTERSYWYIMKVSPYTGVRIQQNIIYMNVEASCLDLFLLNSGISAPRYFLPDGRMVAFVASDNNIYLKKWDYNTEIAVTTDGVPNKIINGVPDWTYEEEFSTSISMDWASDNQTLCYIRYDESQVPMYSFPLYKGTCQPKNEYELYPGHFSYKYPVAGMPNSNVSVHSYDVETRKIKELTLPDRNIEYIPRIKYTNTPDRLIVATLNRDQNRVEFYCVNPKSMVAKSVYVEESKAWIEPITYEDFTLENDGFSVISSRSGYRHIYKYTYAGALAKADNQWRF